MMKLVRTKRRFCLLLLVFFLLTACGPSQGEGDQGAEPGPGQDDLPSSEADPDSNVPQEGTDDADSSGPDGPETSGPGEPGQSSLDDLSPQERLQAGLSINSYRYSMDLFMNGFLQGSLDYFRHGSDVRIEGEADGQSSLMIMDGQTTYMLMPEEEQILKMPSGPRAGTGEPSTPASIEDLSLAINAEALVDEGKTTYDGLEVYVLSLADPASGEDLTLYLHPQYGFPLRLEMVDDMTGDDLVMEIRDFLPGKVDEGLFTLPPDWEMVDLEALPQD